MRLLLIDGHYYAYRSFFAIRELRNSKGEPTNAIFGFAKTVRRMLKDLAPDLGAVLWDEGLPQRRTELQPEYKQQRQETPEELAPQIDILRELVPALGLRGLGLPDTEADDLMACYAVAARARGMEVILATNDKDLFQLVGDGVRVYSTNKTDLYPPETFALIGPDAVEKKWGVPPAAIRDVLALTGDSVDNIPGVDGVGQKTAAKLIAQFGSARHMLAHTGEIANPKLRGKIEAAADRIRQNLEMVALDLDLPLPLPLEELGVRPKPRELAEYFRSFEFRTLLQEVEAELAVGEAPAQGELF